MEPNQGLSSHTTARSCSGPKMQMATGRPKNVLGFIHRTARLYVLHAVQVTPRSPSSAMGFVMTALEKWRRNRFMKQR